MDRDISRKLLQCYPIILEMLTTRGFDTSMYSPMTVEMVKVCASKAFLDPIVVTKTEDTVRESNSVTWSFTTGSREDSILDDLKKHIHSKRVEIEKWFHAKFTPFQSKYPRLGKFLRENYNTEKWGLCTKLLEVYKKSARPVAEVHFCCFDSTKLSAQFDRVFKVIVDSMEKTLEADIMVQHVDTFKELSQYSGEDRSIEIEQEIKDLYMRARTVIFIADNPKKQAVSTPTLIHLQVFCIQHLMFNVLKHKYVPNHDILDTWQNKSEIDEIKRHYHISRLNCELPIIYTSDPVAKFIGLRRDNVCRITDTNDSSGTYIKYRYCRSG